MLLPQVAEVQALVLKEAQSAEHARVPPKKPLLTQVSPERSEPSQTSPASAILLPQVMEVHPLVLKERQLAEHERVPPVRPLVMQVWPPRLEPSQTSPGSIILFPQTAETQLQPACALHAVCVPRVEHVVQVPVQLAFQVQPPEAQSFWVSYVEQSPGAPPHLLGLVCQWQPWLAQSVLFVYVEHAFGVPVQPVETQLHPDWAEHAAWATKEEQAVHVPVQLASALPARQARHKHARRQGRILLFILSPTLIGITYIKG